ncbi:MAG TPA: ester cyclase [Chitinophagaceae bacterium]|nr:ester cyclase [Chitinophagaceae bacterium]
MSNKQILSRMYNTFSGKPKPEEALNEFIADHGLKQHVAFFEAAFPNYQLIADDLIEEGNKVVARARFIGVHAGELFGLAPTHKQVELPFLGLYYFENGKIVDSFISANQLDVMKQLDMVPEMA